MIKALNKKRGRETFEHLLLNSHAPSSAIAGLYLVGYMLKGVFAGEVGLRKALKEAARRLRERGSARSALSLYAFLARFYPDSVEDWVEYAQLSMDQGNYLKAEQIVGRGLKFAPGACSLKLALVRCRYLNGQSNEARAEFQSTLLAGASAFSEEETLWFARTATLLGEYDNSRRVLQESLLQMPESIKLVIELASLERNTGNYHKAKEVLESVSTSFPQVNSLLQIVVGELSVYEQGKRPKVATLSLKPTCENDSLMLLEAALPYRRSGYTYRSHALLCAMRRNKLKSIAFSAPGSAGGLPAKTLSTTVLNDAYQEIDYYRSYLPESPNYRHYPLDMYLQHYATVASSILPQVRPRVLHAASNFKNGIVAASLSKANGIPWVYELRGIWHETQCALGVIRRESARYKYFQQMESECLRQAHVVVTLSEKLKQYVLESSGRSEKSVFVIPNGVDVDGAFARKGDTEETPVLPKGWGTDPLVVGYIGSLNHYEGLDDAIYAIARVQKDLPHLKCFIVGDGHARTALEELARQETLPGSVVFAGRVSQERVPEYMRCLDLFLLPRKDSAVCRTVPPIKPLEAMAMGIPVLSSDLPVLREVLVDQKTGFTFKAGNLEDFISTLHFTLSQESLRSAVASNAYKYVTQEHSWTTLASRYDEVYDLACAVFEEPSARSGAISSL